MNKYDIVIVGGGTAGCSAAYTASKLGLKTLLLEKEGFLGGSMSGGLVVPAMKSSANQINTEFFDNLVIEMKKLGGQVTYENNKGWFNPELLKITLDKMLLNSGVDILFRGNDEYTVCEVNALPGFKSLRATSGKRGDVVLIELWCRYFI